MASFSVENTLTLRNNYTQNRVLAKKSNRDEVSNTKLNQADAQALRKAIRDLDSFDFKDAKESDIKEKIRAFIDTYNFTLDSTKQGTDTTITASYKKLAKLAKDYESQLEDLGIRPDSNGYLKLSSSATKNISGEKFGSFFSKDHSFFQELDTCAKRITSHINISL